MVKIKEIPNQHVRLVFGFLIIYFMSRALLAGGSSALPPLLPAGGSDITAAADQFGRSIESRHRMQNNMLAGRTRWQIFKEEAEMAAISGAVRNIGNTTDSLIALPFKFLARIGSVSMIYMYKFSFGSMGLSWNNLAQMSNRIYTLCNPLTTTNFLSVDRKRRSALIKKQEDKERAKNQILERDALKHVQNVSLTQVQNILDDTTVDTNKEKAHDDSQKKETLSQENGLVKEKKGYQNNAMNKVQDESLDEPIDPAWRSWQSALLKELQHTIKGLESTACCYGVQLKPDEKRGLFASLMLALSPHDNRQIGFYLQQTICYIEELKIIIASFESFEEAQQNSENLKRYLTLVCTTFEQIAQYLDAEGAWSRSGRVQFLKVSGQGGSSSSSSLLDLGPL